MSTAPPLAMLCLASLLLGVSCHAAPRHWSWVRNESGMAYYLDTSNVRMQGAHLNYWILVNFHYDPKLDGAKPYKSALLLRQADCATRTQDTRSVLQYHAPWARGEPVWVQRMDDATLRLEPVEPGSVSAAILDRACALAGKRRGQGASKV